VCVVVGPGPAKTAVHGTVVAPSARTATTHTSRRWFQLGHRDQTSPLQFTDLALGSLKAVIATDYVRAASRVVP
jgi:hypothetical protein